MASKTYEYENRRRIVITSDPGANGITHAEVRIGIFTVYASTPYQCLCYLARRGSCKARAQLELWHEDTGAQHPQGWRSWRQFISPVDYDEWLIKQAQLQAGIPPIACFPPK